MADAVSDQQEVSPVRLQDSNALEREHVMKVYDAIACHFSSTRYKAWPKVQAFIESLPKYSLVADVGCGNGKYFACAQRYRGKPITPNNTVEVEAETKYEKTEDMEGACRYVVGIDSSEGLLRLAQQQRQHGSSSESSPGRNFMCRTDLLRADGRCTALRGEIFDAAISIAVIHHFATHSRRVEAIRELLRLVRPDGRILISVWAKEQPKKRSRNDASDVFIPWEMHENHDKDKSVYQRYYHLFVKGELENLAVEAGALVRDSYYDKENCSMDKAGRHHEAQATLSVSPEWLQRTAEAIASRNGVLLTDCITMAEEGETVKIPSAAVLANIETAVEGLRCALIERVNMSHSGSRDSRGSHAEDVRERQLYVDVVVRVAITGALAHYQRMETQSGGIDSTDASERPLQRCYDTLARGMLHVFEAFQEVHSMRRGHYPPRRHGGSTVGTVGWDTLLLLHFVHRIPRAARDASEHIIDEATGQIVRSWRKLLLSLQAADPQEPPEHSRRRGALAVCNGLLNILFHRYNTHQCRILVNSVVQSEKISETTNDWGKSILRPAQHMTAEVVNFCYHKGRIMLYDRRFEEAYASLREAYYLLPPPGEGTEMQQRNKQRVRFYLTVAGVVHGKVVPEEILKTDDLISFVFVPILSAVQQGDPHAFTEAVDAFGTLFRRRGVYFILQRAKLFCYLLLLARAHTALGSCSGVDNSRIPIPVLTAVYNHIVEEGKTRTESSSGESSPKKHKRARENDDASNPTTMTDDDMIWWTAKLIANGLVRGYISYEHKTIVLSRQSPFPSLTAAL